MGLGSRGLWAQSAHCNADGAPGAVPPRPCGFIADVAPRTFTEEKASDKVATGLW